MCSQFFTLELSHGICVGRVGLPHSGRTPGAFGRIPPINSVANLQLFWGKSNSMHALAPRVDVALPNGALNSDYVISRGGLVKGYF